MMYYKKKIIFIFLLRRKCFTEKIENDPFIEYFPGTIVAGPMERKCNTLMYRFPIRSRKLDGGKRKEKKKPLRKIKTNQILLICFAKNQNVKMFRLH